MDVQELHHRVRALVEERIPSLACGRALLAVSGGGDSIATAALLGEANIIDPAQSAVAHFDHRLRGREAADQDQRAVEALCARYGFDLLTARWDDPRKSEAAARDARYRFLRDAADRVSAPIIVTGHTSDDQAETVMMHAMRGAGLHGLRGIQPEAIVQGVTLARPMLEVWRAETRAYCAAHGLVFVDDGTNADTTLLRNKVRLQVLPAMEETSPGARDALLRLAQEAAAAVTVLEEFASAAVGNASAEGVVMQMESLRALPTAVLPYALRMGVERLTGDVRDLERHHYDLLERAMSSRTGAVLQLPRGIVLHVESDAVVLSRASRILGDEIPPALEVRLPYEGRLGVWDLRVVASHSEPCVLRLPVGAVVRRRRPGDWMARPAGRRKLQDVFVDLKVPRRLRDGVPVIAREQEVFWTPFVSARAAEEGVPYAIHAKRKSDSRSLTSCRSDAILLEVDE